MTKITVYPRLPASCFFLLLILAACRPVQVGHELQAVVAESPTAAHPTLADLWEGRAHFVLQVADSGLPMGESETVQLSDGTFLSLVHSSTRSAETVDSCGDPAIFPGCIIPFRSADGLQFSTPNPGHCLIDCLQCPCSSLNDHIDQQQYPDIFFDGATWWMTYEYRGRTMLRTSRNGLNWREPQRVALTGIWNEWLRHCPQAQIIGDHPFVPPDYECLAGAPPGVVVEDGEIYLFVGVGQSPGGMGCYHGRVDEAEALFEPCANNPLFRGASGYGPVDVKDASVNEHFDFRTVSSAETLILHTPQGKRFYMLYEGVRGPGPGDAGDTQFGLGLARSRTDAIDGSWEKYPHNPLLIDLPGNIGLGHADLLVVDGQTRLYTSLDGQTRSLLFLEWVE